MKKYNEREMKILTRVYIDYKQLERKLSIDIGDTYDIEKVYKYMLELKKKDTTIGFTNIDLDLGYFDFNYKDMLLTISKYNKREVCKLGEDIIIYDDEMGTDFDEMNFEDLEKIVLGYIPFGKNEERNIKKVYIIEILCKDTDNTIYNDNHKVGYTTYEKAKEELDRLIIQEYEGLKENGGDYYICDYNDNGNYQREIWFETKDYTDMLTRYTIVEIETEV